MNKKYLLALAACTLMFAACGDDVTEVNEIHKDGMAVLESGEKLSKQACDTTNAGEMLFVMDSSEAFICDGESWQTLKGADGKDGEDGEKGSKGDSGEDGTNGNDGTSCTATKNTDGSFDLVCGGEKVGTITNGKDGQDGTNGNDGTSCTAESVTADDGRKGVKVTCGDDEVGTIWDGTNGSNGTSCTAESVTADDGRKGVKVTCGDDEVGTIWDGTNGSNGTNGTSCTAEPVTADDGRKGVKVTCGDDEVGTIWDGTNGTNGTDGAGCSLEDNGEGAVSVTCGEGDGATTTTIFKAMCGMKPYDPAKSFCSEGELFSCDDKPYDPKKQYCLMVTRDEMDIYSVEDLLTDSRDNQVYKTVEICNNETSTCQTWMAENLNYSVNPTVQSWCGGGSGATEGDCSVYGRLYTWAAAIDSVALANDADNPRTCGYGKTCSLPTVVQGVCPEGWHLPSYDEWQTLFTAVGGSSKAGTALKSQIGWYSQTGDAADRDAYGFSALPAGTRRNSGDFSPAGYDAVFWSASQYEDLSDLAYDMSLTYFDEGAYLCYYDKNRGYSVRCLKD